ncbi:MAG: SDR family NAD(P)-dependent oxidoreductase [Planctomycetes bacterium]|nr:SDR family NAD(P)-dependent oxidoreductase [Planctomycetota bacterium]
MNRWAIVVSSLRDDGCRARVLSLLLLVNLNGAFKVAHGLFPDFKLTHGLLPDMVSSGWGRIINITSIVAPMGNLGQANYAAAKGGLIAFTNALAREVEGQGVTVNAVAAGFIETDMTAGCTCSQCPRVRHWMVLFGCKRCFIGRLGERLLVSSPVLRWRSQ